MDDNTRYAFCIEMANLARQYHDIDAMNEWYARAWYYLHKNSDDGVRFEKFAVIKDYTSEQ